MSFSSFLTLTDEETKLLLQSVNDLIGKLNLLVDNFYQHFLGSSKEISDLFKNVDMPKQHNMFIVSIGAIISNIDNPSLIQANLDELIDKHILYGIQPFHVPFFSDAYTKTITEIYGVEDPIMKVWLKIIHSTMEYFKSKL